MRAPPKSVSVYLPLSATYDARDSTVEASYTGNNCFIADQENGTLRVRRKVLWVKPMNREVGLQQPNPPTTPTAACWLQLADGSSFAYGQSWSALNLTQLRFTYNRNPPVANASEFVGKTYIITAIGVISSNYDIRYQEATLTVVK
jgi:hypothetical protein